MTASSGYTMIEIVLAVGLVGTLTALALPAAAAVVDSSRARQAAGDIAARFRLARQRAATEGRALAVVFDQRAGRWFARLCADGNGNGVRRAELGGPDACEEDPTSLDERFPGIAIAIDATHPDPGGQVGNADPVRFGPSDVASFSSLGTATAGTIYLLGPGAEYAVRVAGGNARTRILRWDTGSQEWVGQ
jgi:type II secretory pathway pseudopilin PulG